MGKLPSLGRSLTSHLCFSALDKAYPGPEIAVWNFGVVLYVLVYGNVPFYD
jgi:hypothetical protein